MKIREIKLKKNKERTNSLKKNSFLQIAVPYGSQENNRKKIYKILLFCKKKKSLKYIIRIHNITEYFIQSITVIIHLFVSKHILPLKNERT